MIVKAPFGRTGHQSTRVVFGAAALGWITQAEADQTMELLLKAGVNHIDTAASYGDAELRLGPWMKTHRKEFFLATKTGQRTYQEAKDEIHRSLERLQVDSFDLIQLHHLIDEKEWQTALGEDGALRAAMEAREQGIVKFIGVTGHELVAPVMHKRALEQFDFDSVLLPYSYILMQNPQYAANVEALLALCKERNVAVQTIKSIARRLWDDRPRTHGTWYEPLEEQGDIDLAVHWVLGNPQVFLNSVGDIHVMPRVLDAASRFSARPSDEEMQALLSRREMTPMFT